MNGFCGIASGGHDFPFFRDVAGAGPASAPLGGVGVGSLGLVPAPGQLAAAAARGGKLF